MGVSRYPPSSSRVFGDFGVIPRPWRGALVRKRSFVGVQCVGLCGKTRGFMHSSTTDRVVSRHCLGARTVTVHGVMVFTLVLPLFLLRPDRDNLHFSI
jgi:hypothetical protein